MWISQKWPNLDYFAVDFGIFEQFLAKPHLVARQNVTFWRFGKNMSVLGVKRSKNHNVAIEDDEEEEFVVEKIIDKRKGPHGKIQYLIKWKGYENKDNSWEPIDNIYCDDMITEFENEQKNKVFIVKEENFIDDDTIQGQQFSNNHDFETNFLKKEEENMDYYDNNVDMEDQG